MSVYPILLHTVACGWYAFFWNEFLSISKEDTEEWHPRYQDIHELGCRYLTNWNLFMQTLYFSGCLLHDLMKIFKGPNWLKLGTKFQILLSGSFSSLILPTGIFVSVTFWTMYGIDREIVYPKLIDDVIPYWQNHGMHTVILPFVFAEVMTTKHRFLPVKVLATILISFELLYGIVFLETYVEKGRWVYPLFGMLSLPVSIAVMIFLLFLLTVCLFVGIFIQNQLWGEEEKKGYKKPVKKSK
ncbi:androgen-dependent TFPI-regulating protein-like [Adelges cooleyi]|uniref:androgen-dependent TFPI-regulating protein-like n=1 Tax=Adelges cooleyi TaxID=133065 RepID=UPI00217F3FF0|nr:androgen-dependent TFPI-regulating protein-like [Adelges cooleyi]XP_050424841.1 androgen-dependent TFPI-regulating protein-like [Adelges cooleyi]